MVSPLAVIVPFMVLVPVTVMIIAPPPSGSCEVQFPGLPGSLGAVIDP